LFAVKTIVSPHLAWVNNSTAKGIVYGKCLIAFTL
jgi:hypothetical protein